MPYNLLFCWHTPLCACLSALYMLPYGKHIPMGTTLPTHPPTHTHTPNRGWAANIILVLFYMSPLATLWGVLRRRDASSIHWPLALMTVINGLLWVFYGLALSDAFIWAPNGFGAVVGGMNLMLRCLFPARKSRCVGVCVCIQGKCTWLCVYLCRTQYMGCYCTTHHHHHHPVRFARIAQPPPTATPVQPSTTTQLPTDAAVIPPPLVASYPPSCPPSASEGCKDVEGTLSSLSGGTDPTGRGPGVVSAGGVGGGGEGHGTHDGGEGGGDVYEVGDVELGGRMDSSAPLHTTAHS